MTYEVSYASGALKEVKKLSPDTRVRVLKAIIKLSTDPRFGDCRQMVGMTSWRMRVGDYRVIYDIHDEKLVILIIKVQHRREVYR